MRTRRRRRQRAPRGQGERLREEILEATERLLARTGDADALSIRAIARAVGVTPPSIYMHFADRDELITAVCERHFRSLEEATRRAATGYDDPVAALKAMGRAYVRFGLERPEEYRILFMSRTDEMPFRFLERLKDLSGFNEVIAAAQRCIDAGAFRADDAYTVACGLWMGVHGITSLLVAKPHFPWPEREALIEHCLETHCRGLASVSLS